MPTPNFGSTPITPYPPLRPSQSYSGLAPRNFSGKFSNNFETKELPKETDAWKRCKAARISQGKASNGWKGVGAKVRFNLSMYKLHALGDYADTICW